MIQPLDIKTQSFKKGLFGYKSTDVDLFVDTVYKAYDELYTENATLSDELERLNKVVEDNRLKIFDLENKVQKAENVSSYDDPTDVKKSKDIISEAQKQAAEIIAKAKEESDKMLNSSSKSTKEKVSASDAVKETAKSAEEKASAASKFFKKAEEASAAAVDDDEIFVGEIEDNRKPNKMMIGDGEEEDDGDFEFL